MQSNIPKQPTLGNQQDTTDQDYAIGDVVVLTNLCRNFHSDDLFEVKSKTTASLWSVKSKNHFILVSSKEIRPASTAELKAKRRLSETEQSLAEVS